LLGSLDGKAGITSKRRWAIVKRYFATTADVLPETSPALAEWLRRVTGRTRVFGSHLKPQAVQLRRAQGCR